MMSALSEFLAAGKGDGTCLEQGTLEWETGVSTSVALTWFPDLHQLVRSDIEAGPGVDIAADAHDLAPFTNDQFDIVISRSVWEHLARPWVAMHAIARVLRPGGVVFIDTHQTFPLHGYPSDYFRFSVDAMRIMMEDAGLEPTCLVYERPCRIVPDETIANWNPAAPAYLHVQAFGRKL